MKILLLTTLLLLNGVPAFSQTITLSQKVAALTSRMNQLHVQPPAIDDRFAAGVNERLTGMLDGNHILFSIEDLAELTAASTGIDGDITGNTTVYFDLLKGRIYSRLAEMETAVSEFAAKPADLKSATILSRNELAKPASRAKWKTRFNQLLQFTLIDKMLTQGGETAAMPVNLSVAEASARKYVKDQYNLFFRRMRDVQMLEEAYLNAIALQYDPHSLYFSASDKKLFEEELSSERLIYGFNISENEQNDVILSDLVPGSAAWLSNSIHSGDILESLQFPGGELLPVSGVKNAEEVHKLFRESLSDKVKLNLKTTAGERNTVNLTKSKVYSDNDIIKNAVLTGRNKIGYISLPDFYMSWSDTSSLGCANDLAKCLLKLRQENIEGVILDLRGNGGGSLKEAVDLAGIFIDYGPVLAVKSREKVSVLKDFNRGAIYTGPLIVMVDEGSASASEIVAGVLQDYNKAVIVGRQTFGKATSQSILPVDPAFNALSAAFISENRDYGYVNLTNGLLYRVTGKWNQVAGVTPDVQLPAYSVGGQSETERTYKNALLPAAIDKKMPFTALPELPVETLRSASQQRMAADAHFSAYAALRDEYAQFVRRDTLICLDLAKHLAQLQEQQKMDKKAEEFTLKPGFQAASNKFDSEVYAADEILDSYNRAFLEKLLNDFELAETVNILADLISEQKK